MRVCDYIVQYLENMGVKTVYGLMGGGASGLNDGFIKSKHIKYICFHHEQGAGYAGYAEAKYTNNIAVVNPTTGCGGTNCITPLLNAWQDSAPVLFLSGNVRTTHTTNYLNRTRQISLRKYGVQEHNIIETVKSITKYAAFVEDPLTIAYHLDKAIYAAMTGRQGPVWLDIPADVQTAEVEAQKMFVYEMPQNSYTYSGFDCVKAEIQQATKPIIVAGNGIHLSNCRKSFKDFVEYYNVPFVSSYLARDIMAADHRLNLGAIGIKGTRAANFAMQNADLLIIMGCSMNATHVGYQESQFAPNAKKIMLDIDENEALKNTIRIDMFINTDLQVFFDEFDVLRENEKRYTEWKEGDKYGA